MCWHSPEEERRYREEVEARWAAQNKLPGTTTVSVLDKDGNFIGAMPVDWRSRQKIANTVRDLKSWHRNATQVDLTEVNKLRARATASHPLKFYPRLTEGMLPKPTGEAEPYAFAKPEATWSDELREAAQYIHRQHAKVARKHVAA